MKPASIRRRCQPEPRSRWVYTQGGRVGNGLTTKIFFFFLLYTLALPSAPVDSEFSAQTIASSFGLPLTCSGGSSPNTFSIRSSILCEKVRSDVLPPDPIVILYFSVSARSRSRAPLLA